MAIERTNLSDDVYTLIKRRIMNDELPFGEKIHIDNLARELGVSPTPVREALNRLITYGLARSVPHRGIFVVIPTRREVIELCQARMCLELFMADDVVRNATTDEIQAMEAAVERTRRLPEPPVVPLEKGLHGVYVEIGGNTVLVHLYQQVHSLLTVLYSKAIRRYRESQSTQGHEEQHYAEEVEIVRCLAARDAAALKQAIKKHTANLQEFLLGAGVL